MVVSGVTVKVIVEVDVNFEAVVEVGTVAEVEVFEDVGVEVVEVVVSVVWTDDAVLVVTVICADDVVSLVLRGDVSSILDDKVSIPWVANPSEKDSVVPNPAVEVTDWFKASDCKSLLFTWRRFRLVFGNETDSTTFILISLNSVVVDPKET